jgi:hypothetical protein
VGETETTPDQTATGKDGLHLFRCRVGGDIEILRALAQEQVPYASTDDVGLVACFLQPLYDLRRVGAKVSGVDAVVGGRYDVKLGDETVLMVGR